MYRCIVVGTDGSAAAHQALRHAHALANAVSARLCVVHAYRPSTAVLAVMVGGDPHVAASSDDEADVQRQEVQELLQHAVMRLGPGAVQVGISAYVGEPAEVLSAAAADASADLVVVGDRGLDDGGPECLGSVPHRLTQLAPCPVLVVRTTATGTRREAGRIVQKVGNRP